MFAAKTLQDMAPPGLTFGEHCVNLVPYKFFSCFFNKKNNLVKALISRLLGLESSVSLLKVPQ